MSALSSGNHGDHDQHSCLNCLQLYMMMRIQTKVVYDVNMFTVNTIHPIVPVGAQRMPISL